MFTKKTPFVGKHVPLKNPPTWRRRVRGAGAGAGANAGAGAVASDVDVKNEVLRLGCRCEKRSPPFLFLRRGGGGGVRGAVSVGRCPSGGVRRAKVRNGKAASNTHEKNLRDVPGKWCCDPCGCSLRRLGAAIPGQTPVIWISFLLCDCVSSGAVRRARIFFSLKC